MKRNRKSREKQSLKMKRQGLQLTGQTVIVRNEGTEGDGQTGKRIVFALFLPCLFSLLMLQGLLLDFCRIWNVEYQREWTASLVLVSAVAAAVFVIGKRFRPVPWAAAAIFTAAGLVSKEYLIAGGKELANPVLRSWSDYYGTRLGVYKIDLESHLEFILLYIALWLAFGFVFAMQRRGTRILLIAPAASLVSLGLLTGKGPDVEACIYLLAGLLPSLAYTGDFIIREETGVSWNQSKRRDRRKNGLQQQIWIAGSILTGGILIAGFFSYALLGKGIAAGVFENHEELLAYQKNLEQDIRNLYINRPGGFSIFGGSNGEDGEITNQSPRFTGKEMFRVTVDEKPQTKFYFRGYVGGTYEDGRWSPVSEEDFSQKVKAWGYRGKDAGKVILNRSFEHANAVIQDYSWEAITSRTVSMEIMYSDACGDFAYLPYYTQLYANELESFTVEADAVVRRPEGIHHISAYTAELFADDGGREISLWMDQQEAELIIGYEEDVRNTYTKVPAAGLKRLQALADTWAKQGYGVEDYDYNYAIPIKKVTEELAARTEYSRKLKRVPRDTDVVENFLFDSGEGFCIHYASAGTLLLRQLGVPARYVSGYAVDPSDFTENPDGSYTAVVKDEKGHAWAEVYANEQGWIPVELTKGSLSMNYGMDQESVRQAEYTRDRFGHKETETQSSSEKERETEKNEHETQKNQSDPVTAGKEDETSGIHASKVLLLILAVILLSAAAGAGIYWKRKELEGKRRFYSRDTRVSALEISHGIYRALYHAGIMKEKNLADEEYIRKAAEKLKFLGEGELEAFLHVVQRSVFSDYVPTKEEIKNGRNIYFKIAAAIRNKAI